MVLELCVVLEIVVSDNSGDGGGSEMGEASVGRDRGWLEGFCGGGDPAG